MEQPSQEILAEEFMPIRGGLINYASGITKNEQDAEEIVSTVIEKFLVKLKSGELQMYNANYKTYLYTAVRNRAFNLIRDRQRRFKIIDSHEWENASNSNQENELNLKQLTDLYLQSLAELPDHQNEAMQLRTLGDCSYEEIMERQGIKMGTVMSRLSRARKEIKEVLSANADYEDLLKYTIL